MKLSNLAKAYLRSGLYSFSASANEVLHEELVERHAYLTDEEYIRMMSVGAMIPGPFHVNLVIATGYSIAGLGGSLLAVGSFIFPGFLVAVCAIMGLRNILSGGLDTKISGIAAGILAAVAGLVLSVVIKLARKHVRSSGDTAVALVLCGLLLWTRLPFIAVILTAGTTFFLLALVRLRRHS